MTDSDHFIFKLQRIEDGDWQVQAHCPGAVIEYVTGFKSESEASEWTTGDAGRKWKSGWLARNK